MMTVFLTRQEYEWHFQKLIEKENRRGRAINHFFYEQLKKMDQLIEDITPENYWHIQPRLIGLDAKIVLMTELIKFDDLTDTEIIRIVENDYRSYLQELCGYDLRSKPRHSIIFNIL